MAHFRHRRGVFRRSIPLVIAVVAAGSVAMTGGAGANASVSSGPDSWPNTWPILIINGADGLCLNAVASGVNQDGDRVQLYKCD
jgi:hypothetical protein